jgi:uncharacterized repeat protein (TIGR01451 family)
MYKTLLLLILASPLWGAGFADESGFQTTTPHVFVRVLAEVQTKVGEAGRQFTKLVPADRVVPGDLVYYTLEVRNAGPSSIDAPVVIQPVPAHMAYVANTAGGPGCEVSYSLDGGRTFAKASSLSVALPSGAQRPALAADYTHIRFQFTSLVKANSTAFLRFRARVK